MFSAFYARCFALFVITSSAFISAGNASCYFEKHVSYNRIAKQSWWTITTALNGTNETECEVGCCLSYTCTMYLFSSNSTLYNNSNCILMSCHNKSLCLRKSNLTNGAGIFVRVGIQDIQNTSNSSSNAGEFNYSSSVPTSQYSQPSKTTNVHYLPPLNGTSKLKSTSIHHMLLLVSNKTAKINSTKKSQLNETSNINSMKIHDIIKPLLNGTSTTITHMPPLIGTPKSTMQSLVTRNGSTVVVSSRTTQTQTSSFLNHTLRVHLRKSRHSSSLQESLSNGLFAGNIMSSSGNHTVSSLVIISDMLSSLEIISSDGTAKTSALIPSKVFDNIPKGSSQHSIHGTYAAKQHPPKKFPESHSHTTPISLVISLILGTLFFGAVVFLIGRRWGETCFRRGYSQVDYLLNDYE